MYNDSLYRLSLKCLIRNHAGEVLVVKESGRDFWDLPGGGMEYGDGIHTAIARELQEEVGYNDDFTYKVVALDEPVRLVSRDVWQVRAVLEVTPNTMDFKVGEDADAIQFVDPAIFEHSTHEHERKIYHSACRTMQAHPRKTAH